MLDYLDFEAKLQSAPTGKGGVFGSKGQYYEYYATMVIALAQGPCVALRNVWSYSGMLENLSGISYYTIPSGGGTYTPVSGNAAPIQNNLGVTKSEAYSVPVNPFGGAPGTLTGTQQVPLKQVSSSPGLNEYTFNPITGAYGFGSPMGGQTVALNYSYMFSLYYFEQTQAAIIPANAPWTVDPDNISYFYADNGVKFVDDDTAGIPVSGIPSATNEYWVNNGEYVFFSGDAGRTVYINYTYITNSSTITSSSVLNLTFFNGAQSQSPWSYLVSAHPSNAFGYTGICYIASEELDLGQTASVPPYNYEVIGQCIYPGQIDAMICDVIQLLLTDFLCGIDFPISALDIAGTWVNAAAHWVANGFFISDNITAQSGIADLLGKYCEAGNTAAFFSGGLLKLVPYTEVPAVGNGAIYQPPTNPVAYLTWDDLVLPGKDKPGRTLTDDFYEVDENAAQDRYNYTQCNWADRDNSYNNALLTDQNDSSIAQYGIRVEDAQSWGFICLSSAVQWALNCRLKRNIYINKNYKFTLKYTFDWLEPMDVVVMPTGEAVRIKKIEEDENQFQAIEAENFIYGGSSATLYANPPINRYQPTQGSSSGGSVYPAFIQQTTQQTGGVLYQLQIAVASKTPNFGGCQVWLSIDSVNYSQIGVINESNSVGILSAPLAASADPDTTDTLSVDMTLSGAQLVGATQAVADAFGTLCAIISPDGLTCEFISYENVALTGTGRYNLTYLRRGVYGSPVSSFPQGSTFVYIGSQPLFQTTYKPQFQGQPIYIKMPSFNLQGAATQPLSQCKAYELFLTTQGSVPAGPIYRPSNFTDGGTEPTSNPTAAYDGSNTTAAIGAANSVAGPMSDDASCTWDGFPSFVTDGTQSLYISYKLNAIAHLAGSIANASVNPSIGTSISINGPASSRRATAVISIPAGTDISTISVSASASTNTVTTLGSAVASYGIYEIWIT